MYASPQTYVALQVGWKDRIPAKIGGDDTRMSPLLDMNKYVLGILAFTFIDVFYTVAGAVYGGGGAELNPLLSRYTNPVDFVLFMVLAKIFVISGLLLGLVWLYEYEKNHPFKCAGMLGLYANAVYGFALFGVLGLNVLWQIA